VARFEVAKTRTKNEVYAIRMVIEELYSRPRDLPTHSLNRRGNAHSTFPTSRVF
jgi:hypothetical protein